MNYDLSTTETEKTNLLEALKPLVRFIRPSAGKVALSFICLLINSLTTIVSPHIIGETTNKLATTPREDLIRSLLMLAAIYITGAIFSYLQIRIMGQVGQEILFRIRNAVFNKLQSLPLKFFNQNKSGDLISRINNDTDKMNQAFSETLLRFTGDIVVIVGITIVMLVLNPFLGLIALATLWVMLFITWILSGWIKRRNDKSLQKLGEMSGEIQESLTNFKVTVVFNRRDYFRKSFAQVNENNRHAATGAGIANAMLSPIYNYAANVSSALILLAGIQILIIDKVTAGMMPEFGTLVAFILYANTFFNPLKEMAELFSQFQTGAASWSRLFKLLRLQSDLKQIESTDTKYENLLMRFEDVSFGYSGDAMILDKINLELEPGKTYALVGPTGGGKSTTASLMVRLYDATAGRIFFRGKDIRSYAPHELAEQIGFILQEPFLFTGTIAENVKYGNEQMNNMTDDELEAKLHDLGLEGLIHRFSDGLQTVINPGAENISLGQRQLISFVRVLLRQPKLLILDEATANVDTVTEKLLEEILNKLPADTTKVIIAHRLNTIESADQIFFISGGKVEKPIDFKGALNLINTAKKTS